MFNRCIISPNQWVRENLGVTIPTLDMKHRAYNTQEKLVHNLTFNEGYVSSMRGANGIGITRRNLKMMTESHHFSIWVCHHCCTQLSARVITVFIVDIDAASGGGCVFKRWEGLSTSFLSQLQIDFKIFVEYCPSS